jgi:hypothetical protein
MQIQFGGMSYRHASLPFSAQELVNAYLEPAPPGAKSLAGVLGCYGIEAFGTVGNGPIRGSIARNGIPYVVSGTGLYRVATDGTGTLLGTIPGSARVSMACDETNIMVVADTIGYVYNGSTVAQITDADFPGATMVANLDGYYLIIEPNTGKFYISANRNPSSWNALDFASAEKYPDDLVQIVVNYGEAVLLGRESGEIWVNTGNADFPLERQPTGIFEKGCLSRYGAAKADNRVFFPGHDGAVYVLEAYQPVRVSTYAIEQAIASAEDREFIGLAWNEGGHQFYGLTCADFTLAYDISTGLWHRRQSYGAGNWRILHTVRAHERMLVADGANRIGYLSPETASEFGQVLLTRGTCAPISQDNKRLFHSRLELVFEQGVGLISGQGSDPKVMLRYSDDGGRTWSSERWRSLGRQGQFKTRTIWFQLGASRDRVYEYAISDPVRRTLILATLEAEAGAY